MYAEHLEKVKGEHEEIQKSQTDFPRQIVPGDVVLKVVNKMVQDFVETNIPDLEYEIYVKESEHTYRALIEYAEEQQKVYVSATNRAVTIERSIKYNPFSGKVFMKRLKILVDEEPVNHLLMSLLLIVERALFGRTIPSFFIRVRSVLE